MRRTTSGPASCGVKEICSACAVLGPRRQHALAHREWCGVWGGPGGRERQAMRRGMEHRSAAMR